MRVRAREYTMGLVPLGCDETVTSASAASDLNTKYLSSTPQERHLCSLAVSAVLSVVLLMSGMTALAGSHPVPPLRPPSSPPAPAAAVTGPPPIAQASLSPAIPGSVSAGRTPTSFGVSYSGAATYSIPLWTPPGVGSVQLSLALSYNSRSPDGVMGVGWALSGLSAVTRCNKTWAQDGAPAPVTNTTADRFCLDGQQLKLVSGTYGVAGSVYATEIESFSEIAASGTVGQGPSSFTVTTKNGLIYDYGLTSNAQIMAGTTGTVRTWALSRIRDRVGNKITFTYANDTANGTYRISEIDYPTTATAQGPFYSVTFTYGSRASGTNQPKGYLAGNLVQEPNQLNTISIQNYGSSTPTKTYNLTYATNVVSSRLELQKVQECSATNCFQPTQIAYQAGATGWLSTVNSTGIATAPPSTYVAPISVDLNGDGAADLLYPVTVSGGVHWWAALATSSGFGPPIDTGVTTSTTNRASPQIITGDFAGLGQQQFLAPVNGFWYVYTYIPSSGFTGVSTGVQLTPLPGGEYLAVDYDGDGLPDLVSVSTDSLSLLVRRNTTGASGVVTFASTATTVFTAGLPGGADFGILPSYGGVLTTADFNGDGKADILVTTLHQTAKTQSVLLHALISNGFGAQATDTHITSSSSGIWALIGDWNGDGCSDVIMPTAVFASNCNGGFVQVVSQPDPRAGAAAFLAVDWDGDGRMDLVYLNGSNNTWYVQRSHGDGIAPAVALFTAPTNTSWFPLDQNGDGLIDLAFVDGNNGNVIKYQLHAGQSTPADLATSFTDGFGMNQSPTYGPLNASNYKVTRGSYYPELIYQGPLYVVNQFTASDGTGGTYQNQFFYYDAYVQVQGRGFEGFYLRTTVDTRNALQTDDWVEQSFPYTGLPSERLVRDTTPAGNVISDRWGTPTAQTITGLGGNEVRYFPYFTPIYTDEYNVPAGALYLITHSETDYVYDSYGSPTSVATTTTDQDPGSPYLGQNWTSTVTNTFYNDTANNCFGLPNTTTVQNAVPGQTTDTRTYNYGGDTTKCRTASQTIEPSTAALTVSTTLAFDGCGNVNSIAVVGHTSSGSAMPTRTTGFSYGTRCQLPETVTNALSQSTSIAYYYNFGVPSSVKDPNLLVTSWSIDDFGRKTLETRPDNTSIQWTRAGCALPPCWGVPDLRLQVIEYPRDTGGNAVTTRWLYYDGFDRLRYDESNRVFGTGTNDAIVYYDSLGRPVTQYQPYASASNGYRSWTYDSLNRVTAAQLYQPSGTLDRTTTVGYSGRTTTVTDPLNHATQRITDVAGRLRRVTDPSPGATTYYDFDAFGNLNKITDAVGKVSSGTYNRRGFRTQWVDADTGTWSYFGDSLNELTSWTDAKSQSFGAGYDGLGRMTSRTEPEGTSNWTWGTVAASHNIGRLQAVTGPGYAEGLAYDSAARLQTRTITTDQAYQFDFAYNSIGALDTLTYPTSPIPSGGTGSRFKIQYAYSYGAPYRITDITDSPTTRTLWTLGTANDYSSPLTETLGTTGTATSVTSTYKPWTDELMSIKSGIGISPQTNRQNLAYQWDTAGNLTQRADSMRGFTENFGYDALNRLTGVTGTTALTVQYDAAGDVTYKSDVSASNYAYANSSHPHAVTTAGSSTFSYDANGNAITRNGSSVTWASFNLPTAINSGSYSNSYAYGPDHQRIQQIAVGSDGTATTRYAGGLLETLTPSTGAVRWRNFVVTPGSAEIVVSRNTDHTTSTTFVLSDHLGSSDAVLDKTGALLVAESFTPFGARRNGATWIGVPSSGDAQQFANTTRDGFTGHEMADAVGLVHMGGRVYDPVVGRFLSVDPIVGRTRDSQSVNPYAYVGNRPVSATDPTGLDAAPCDFLCNSILLTFNVLGQWFVGGIDRPPPPPATALPGVSAQGPAPPCSAGNLVGPCGGGAPFPGVTPGFNPLGFGDPTGAGDESTPSSTPRREHLSVEEALRRSALEIEDIRRVLHKHADTDRKAQIQPIDLEELAENAVLLLLPGPDAIVIAKAVGKAYDVIRAAKLANAARGAIGATGKIGEAALKNLGGESQAFFRTSQGTRYVDQLINGIANESKVGYQTLNATTRSQIAKDVELIQSGQIQGAAWHFFRSPVTGLGGPSGPLSDALRQAGIDVIIH